ncbi:MAG: VOC family protein [Bacteroidota bacterium]
MNPLFNILTDPSEFLENLFIELNKKKINVEKYQLDHICYRTESVQQYIDLKNKLIQIGELLTESNINGRPIATFKLIDPILHGKRKIFLLELPSPKPGSFYPSGYEHVEFVIDEPLDVFMDRYPKINFDKKGMKKKVNPEVRIKFAGFSVKFHLHDLEYVIEYLD